MDTTIQKVKDNDEVVVTKLYNDTINKAYFVAKRLIKDEDTVMDILQDSYITAYQKIEQLDKIENFGKWLDTIVINKAKDYLKKKKEILFTDLRDADGEEFEIQEESKDFKPEETIDYAETKRLVMEIIDALPAEQRMCILLYYYKEMSVGEISETLSCSTGTIKSRLNYARKTIKTKVEELEKKGTKLYGISIFPFLHWLLKEEANGAVIRNSSTLCSHIIKIYGESIGQKAIEGTVTKAVVNSAAGTATKTGITFGAKMIIGVVVIGTITGGSYTVARNINPEQEEIETIVETEIQEENIVFNIETEETTATEEVLEETEETGYVLNTNALEAYRDLLMHPENYGLTTTINEGTTISAQNLAIAFCDLNKDGIPEAVVDNLDATNICNADVYQALYSIVDGKPQFIDYISAAYGGCFISKDGYLTDEEWHMGVSITSYGYDATTHQIKNVLIFYAETAYDDSIHDYQILDGTVYDINNQSTQQLSAEEAQTLYNQYCSNNNKACDLQRVNFGDIDWTTEDLTKYTTYTRYM